MNEGFTEQLNIGRLASGNKSKLFFTQKLALFEQTPSVSNKDGLNAVLNNCRKSFFISPAYF